MVGEKGEETSRSGSTLACSSLPPRKRLLTNSKQIGCISPDSSSSASLARMPKKPKDLPNFSDCHCCGSRMNNKGKDQLQPLGSVWRVVLLCKTCFDRVESSAICSYCFKQMSEEGIGCHECGRRLHYGCVLKFRGFAAWSYSSSDSCLFTCVDCWVPKPLANSNRVCRNKNPSRDNKSVSNACSVGNSRVSGAGNCSKSLKDLVKDAEINAEKKIAFAARAREKALNKAVVAKRTAELARNALNLAAVSMRGENGQKDSPLSNALVLDDAKLAVRLHRAINSSPRISRNLCSMNSDCLIAPETWHCSSNSISSESDSGNPSVCGKLEVCTDNKLFDNPDRTVSEPSVRIDTSDHYVDMDAVEADIEVPRQTSAEDEKCRGNGEEGLMINSLRGLESCLVKMCNSEDDKIELPLKEEEASCSDKLINSSGDDNSMDSGIESYQKQGEFEHKVISNNSEIQFHLACVGDSSALPRKKCDEPDRFLRKYSKRCSSVKAISEPKYKIIYEEFPVESEASVPGLPLLQRNCSEASRTFSDASFQSPSVPFQASTYASGPCQS